MKARFGDSFPWSECMAAATRQFARPALDLVAEALWLLRRTPATDYVIWFAGAAPFAAALLFFWADMSHAALAESRLATSALGLALLFLWLKTCQSVFAARLLDRANSAESEPWNLRRWARIFVTQAILQPSGLLLLPVALLITVPFGWVAAFYQNATVLADRAEGRSGTCARLAWQQALLWPGQNHGVLSALTAAWFVAVLNAGIAVFTVPQLLKMLFGVESRMTLSPETFLNTTFLAVIVALGTLALDPLTKAVYVIRCFHGVSLATGDDLRAQLRHLRQAAQVGVAVLALSWFAPRVTAAETPPSLTTQGAPVSAELDRAISDVLDRAEYTWRAPRDLQPKLAEADMSAFQRVMQRLNDWFAKTTQALEQPFERFFKWLTQKLSGSTPRAGPNLPFSLNFAGLVEFLMWLLVALVAVVLVWFVVKVWRRRLAPHEATLETRSTAPDLHAEFVAADQLPEDGWLAMANDLMAQGDLRLALRAFYLAALAHLARREFIRLARFKSNRDYELELRRRARALPAITTAFSGTVREFDRAWYGAHEVTAEGLADFAAQVEQVRAA
jgi:hypothetical protein